MPASPAAIAAGGPNPALAGVLAGFFPFGVGAVYTGQYAKGLAHLVIFTLLVLGASSGSEAMGTVFGLGIAAFYIYQIIDSVRSARAIQLGLAPPDPFGLGTTFSTGPNDRVDVSKVPVGAIVLIGLGVVFLLHTLNVWDFSAHRVWPLVLIGIGAFLLLRRLGLIGSVPPGYDRSRNLRRGLMGPAILLTLGFQFLLESMGIIRFSRTLPLLLIVIGLVKIFQSSAGPDPLQGPPAYPGYRAAVRNRCRRGPASVFALHTAPAGSEAGGEKWLAPCKVLHLCLLPSRRDRHGGSVPWPGRWC